MHHRDSLGSDLVIHPGELGLMTAGGGIAHSEVSPPRPRPACCTAPSCGWRCPTPSARARPPSSTTRGLPVLTAPGLRATVLLGDVDGAASPGRTYTPIVGVDVELDRAPPLLPLTPEFEHAVLTVSGTPEVDGGPLAPVSLRLPRLRPVVAAPVRRRARPPARCWAASRSRSRS